MLYCPYIMPSCHAIPYLFTCLLTCFVGCTKTGELCTRPRFGRFSSSDSATQKTTEALLLQACNSYTHVIYVDMGLRYMYYAVSSIEEQTFQSQDSCIRQKQCYQMQAFLDLRGGLKRKPWKQKPSKQRLHIKQGGKQGRIIHFIKSKIMDIETAEIKECLYCSYL